MLVQDFLEYMLQSMKVSQQQVTSDDNTKVILLTLLKFYLNPHISDCDLVLKYILYLSKLEIIPSILIALQSNSGNEGEAKIVTLTERLTRDVRDSLPHTKQLIHSLQKIEEKYRE